MRKIAEMFYELYKKEKSGCTHKMSQEFFEKEREFLKSLTREQFRAYGELEMIQIEQEISIEINAMEFLLRLIHPKEEY